MLKCTLSVTIFLFTVFVYNSKKDEFLVTVQENISFMPSNFIDQIIIPKEQEFTLVLVPQIWKALR